LLVGILKPCGNLQRVEIFHAADDLALVVSAMIVETLGAFQAETMTEQIAHGDVLRDPIIVELKVRQVLNNGVIPAKFAFVHQHADERGGEGFGGGANRKDGIRVHGFGLARFEHAVALRENLIALGNRYRRRQGCSMR
jgi:hypothetical protein